MASDDSIFEIVQDVRSGKRSASEIAGAHFDRIEREDGHWHAFLSHDRERALSAASSIDAARTRGDKLGNLAGVPIAIKDNLCTAFGTTTCGSKMLEHYQSPYDAHVVERLRAAGAILVGKTNLDEFAMGGSTEYGAFGATPNPWDSKRVAGGSSGGSAAAVAARLVPGALGSDTGGSIRQPAAYCGVVGLKPSYGRVSRYGLVAFGSSLDQIGPFATNVRDAALLLGEIAGHDERDATSVNAPVPDYLSSLDRPLAGLRVGVYEAHLADGLSEPVRQSVQRAVDLMRDEGATIVPIQLPHMAYAIACYYIIAPAEASSNLARFDGVHYGYRTPAPKDVIDLYASSRGQAFGDEVKRRIMLGTYALSSGYYDAYYDKALRVRTLIRRDFARAFEQVDVLASPVAPTTAFAIGEKCDDPLAMYLTDTYTIAANLAGLCAMSVPCGFDEAGLPIGLHLTAAPLQEETLLAAGHQYQVLTDYHAQRPPPANSADSGSAA